MATLLGAFLVACTDPPGQDTENNRDRLDATQTPLPTIQPKKLGGTATPTLEPPSPVTAVPDVEIPVASFSPGSIGRSTPSDVLEELAFFIGGGGAGCVPGYSTEPEIISAESQAELHDFVVIQSCGWQPGDLVTVTVLGPEGLQSQAATQILQSIEGAFLQSEWVEGNVDIVDSYGEVNFGFKTDVLRDPPGIYTVLLSGSSGAEVSREVEVVVPQEATLYWNDDDSLLLYNFSPGEEVRLFAYSGPNGVDETGRGEYDLYAWQQFAVNPEGVLVVNPELDASIGWYAVIGAQSGEVGPQYPSSPRLWGVNTPTITAKNEAENSPVSTEEANPPISDTGVQACHLSATDKVTAGENARLWSQPNVDSGATITALTAGQNATVLSGPVWGKIRRDLDASGWWWEVESGNIRGWIWEGRIQECAQ